MVLGWTRPGRVGRRRIPKESGVEILRFPIFLSSSMAEHSAVNRVVVGSSPTWGAIPPQFRGGFLFYIAIVCLRCWRVFSLEHVLQDTVHYPLRR